MTRETETSLHFACRAVAALGFLALFVMASAVQTARAHEVRFIASYGDNANDCTRTAPCLTLLRGRQSTPPGGELIILDSGDFGGGVSIGKSMTISAVGVSATIGGPITIDDTDATVVLRGLRLNGAGASGNGIDILAAAAVHIEDCEIQNFGNHGIAVITAAPTKLFVSGSVSRNNGFDGLVFLAGAGGALTVDNSRFEGNASGGLDIQFSAARISRTTAAGNASYGIFQLGGETNIAWTVVAHNGVEGYALFGAGQMTLEQSVARGNLTGLRVVEGSTARLSDSVVTNNSTGLSVEAGSTLLTRGNNTVSGNTTDVSGTLTSLGGI